MSNEQKIIILKQKVDQINAVSPTFCLAKWKQSTTTLYNGMTHSCHHPVQHKIQLENLSKSKTSLHNTPEKLLAREQMLNGAQPEECNYCWNIENINKDYFSDRHYKSADEGTGIWQTFEEVVASGNGREIHPAYFEVAFENVCNFKCSYCTPDVSSRWMEEIERHGAYKLSKHEQHHLGWLRDSGRFPIHHRDPNPYIDQFWKWWPELYQSLDTFRITGGEPLLSDNTWRIFDYIAAQPRKELRFSINTNACVPDAVFDRFIAAVNNLEGKIRSLSVYTSAESTGAQAEYSRFGMDWNKFTVNVDKFLSRTKTKLHIMTTVNALSVSTFHELLNMICQLRAKYDEDKGTTRLGFNVSYLRWPNHQCITNLPRSAKGLFESNIRAAIAELAPSSTEAGRLYLEEVNQLERLIEFMWSREPVPEEVADFKLFFDEYDRRRKTNFVEVFPELAEMMSS